MRVAPLALLALLLVPEMVFAEGIELITSSTAADGTQSYSTSIQILLLMTAMSLIPAGLISLTSFTRIIVVLAILRQALGTGQTSSNQVLLGLALFLSIFIMMPVFQQVYDEGVKPYMDEEIEFEAAVERASLPVREFMLSQTRETELELFVGMSTTSGYDSLEEVPFQVLMPSFITSELKTAFQIGFLIFIPFLIIDLVVASILMSMGMMMLSPMLISLPFKIMLFVLIDGWTLVLGTLTASFAV